MSHWKKKASQLSLTSKGSVAYKTANQSPKIQAITPEMPIIKNTCRIMGFGYIVTPQFKGTCTLQSAFAFAYRYRLACQPTSVGATVSPSKFVAPITSTYTLSVA